MSRQNKNDHLSRFQELLREIFQFDFADLDTGIYRLFRLREAVNGGRTWLRDPHY